MKKHAIQLSIVLAAVLAAPVVLAGNAINKCTDGAGRVTLTDQPCGEHMASAIAVPGTQEDSLPDNAPLAVARKVDDAATGPLLRQARWIAPSAPQAALASDVATLKQARIQMMLLDAAPRNTLAAR